MTLVEIDPQLAALAAENAQLNGLEARVRAVALDVAAPARAFAAAGLAADSVARVLMNPPFNDPARQRARRMPRGALAHAAPRAVLAAVWVKTAARLLRAARHADADLARGRACRRAGRARAGLRRASR